MKSFYRRPLPPNLIPFTSQKGKQLFKQCLDEGLLEGYFGLAENYVAQKDPAFCGLGTLAMCLNALEVDPGKQWKGIWRWYSDEMLECCTSLEVVRQRGTSCDEFQCIGKCNGLLIEFKPANKHSVEEFRNDLTLSSKSNQKILVVSFDRTLLGQTGTGHYSPIGAFLPSEDKVLIMDVARFKYPSFWASCDLLFKAMNTFETGTFSSRGYFIVSRNKNQTSQLLTRMMRGTESMLSLKRLDRNEIQKHKTVKSLLQQIINCLPTVKIAEEGIDLAGPGLTKEFEQDLHEFRSQIQSLDLYKIVVEISERPLIDSVLLLSMPEELLEKIDPEVKRELDILRNVSLSDVAMNEIAKLRLQMEAITDFCGCHSKQ